VQVLESQFLDDLVDEVDPIAQVHGFLGTRTARGGTRSVISSSGLLP
jgi:hypothetical protein